MHFVRIWALDFMQGRFKNNVCSEVNAKPFIIRIYKSVGPNFPKIYCVPKYLFTGSMRRNSDHNPKQFRIGTSAFASVCPSWMVCTAWPQNIVYTRPDLVDWRQVERRQVRERIDLAFHVMDREYGVTRLLDPEGEYLPYIKPLLAWYRGFLIDLKILTKKFLPIWPQSFFP